MAQVIDELGRVVEGQKTANLTLNEIKKLVAASVQSGVGKATPFNKETSKPATEKLVALFEKYTKEFDDAVKEQKDYLKDMSKTLQDIANKKNEKKDSKEAKPTKKDKDAPKASVWKNLEGLAKQGLKKHSIGVHDTHCEKVLNEIKGVLEQMRDGGGPRPPKPPKPPIPSSPKPPEDGGGGGGDSEDEELKEKKRHMNQLQITRIRETALKNILGVIQDQILGFDVMNSVLDGVLDKERQFVQEARKISYEIEGATQDQTKLMRQFENIDKTVAQTGKTRQEFIERYTKTLRMGIKDLKKVRAITIAQLNTEEQLGIKAGELGDTFVDWAQGLKMNEGQIAEMGRGMRDVARFTGLSGDALKDVVNKSEQFITNLKTAGTATAESLKNIIELQANFKKVGVDGGKIMDAMTSTNKFLEADSGTFALLAKAAQQAGVYGKLFNGTLLQSKTSMKAMGKQFAGIANQFGVAGSSAEELRASFANMSDEMKAKINVQLKASYNIEAGELFGTLESFENASKSLAEKLGDVNKKLKSNLTLEEKAIVLEEERKLKLSASLSALTALDEAAKSSKSMGDALAKFGKRRGEFEGNMAALGQAWTSEADVARGAIQSAMDSVNKGLKAAGKQELSIDSSTIEQALKDPTAFRELTAKLSKAEQEASTAAKAQLDPLSSAAQTLKEINDTLRNLANAGFSSIFNSAFGQAIVWLAAIAGAALGIWKIYNEMTQLVEFFKQALAPEKYAKQMDALFDLAIEGTKKGSIYTHDIHLEKLLNEVPKQLGNIASILAEIKNCICSQTQASANAAPKAAAAQTESKPTAADKSLRRHQEKQMKQEKWENKQKARNIKMETKNTLGEKKLVSKDMKTQAAPTGDFDAGILDAMGGDMVKNAAAIAILAVGVMALGAAIIFLGKKILDFLGLDMTTVMQTAGAVAAVVAAGGAIAMAAIGVYKLLETKESKEFVEGAQTSYTDVLKMAGAILLIGPGLVILGAAIVWMCKKVIDAFGLDISTVAETAGAIAAIAAAAGAIAWGVKEAMEALDEISENPMMKKIWEDPWPLIKNMAMGAVALLVLAPAIVGLGAAIIWMSSKILGFFGMDAGTAAKIGLDVAAVIGAAATIIGGVILASAALALVGWAVMDGGAFLSTVALFAMAGALAIMILTPAILALGLAIIKMAQLMMYVTGIDMGTAAKVAGDVAAVIGAAAFIAGAVIASTAALAILGVLATSGIAFIAAGFALIGAKALMLLTPAIILLSAAIIGMAKGIAYLTGLDGSTSKAIAENVSGIIGAAASIAWSVLSAGASLAILGMMATSGLAFIAAGFALLGAKALLVLTPAMVFLSAVIINMARDTAVAMKMGPTAAAKIAEGIAGIFKAAADIAWGVLSSGANLAILGMMATSGLAFIAAGFALLGAKALLVLTPAMVFLSATIINMARDMAVAMKMGPTAAAKIATGIVGIFKASSDIMDGVISASKKLAILGLFSGVAYLAAPLMWMGAKAMLVLTPAMVFISTAIINMARDMAVAMKMGPTAAAKIATGIAGIFKASFDIVDAVISTSKKLAILGLFSGVAYLAAPLMWMGANAMLVLTPAMVFLSAAIIDMARDTAVAMKMGPTAAAKIATGIAGIFKASSDIMDAVISAKNKLENLGLFSGVAYLAAPLMWMGAKRMRALTPAMVSLSASIIKMAKDMAIEMGLSPTDGAKIAEGISGIFKASSDIMDAVISAKSKLSGFAMGGFWDEISTTLNSGIIEPIKKNLPATKEIEDAAGRINALAEVLLSVKSALELLSEVMTDIKGMGLDMNAIKTLPLTELMALGTMTKANGAAGAVASNPSDKVNQQKDSRKEQEASTAFAKDFDTFLVQAISPGSGIFVTDMLLIQTMKELFKNGMGVKTSLGKIPINVKGPAAAAKASYTDDEAKAKAKAKAKAALENSWKGAIDPAIDPTMTKRTVRPAFERGLVNPTVSASRPSIQKGTEINPYTARRDRNASRRAAGRGAEVQSINSAHQRIEEENKRASASSGAATTPVATTQGRTIPPMADVHSEVRQNAAGREPSTSQVTSPELAEIAKSTSQEVDQQKQMVSLLEEMLKLFKGGSSRAGGSSGGGGTDTSSNTIGQKPTNYYRWPSGKHFQTAGQQILNIGSQTV